MMYQRINDVSACYMEIRLESRLDLCIFPHSPPYCSLLPIFAQSEAFPNRPSSAFIFLPKRVCPISFFQKKVYAASPFSSPPRKKKVYPISSSESQDILCQGILSDGSRLFFRAVWSEPNNKLSRV